MSATEPLFEAEAMRLVQAKHGAFIYNKNDLYIGRSLERYGEWCEGEIESLLQIVEPGDIVVDVGANIGTHTVPLARKVGQKGGVLAIEPQRLVYQALCGNVALNGLINVVSVNAAAGAAPGRIMVPLIDPSQPLNWAGLKAQGHEDGEETEVMTLDSLQFTRCALVKLDVGGMEAEVLAGGRTFIGRCQPMLFISANEPEETPALLEAIDDLGYDAWWHIAMHFQSENHFANPENVFDGLNPDANLICAPRSDDVTVDGFEPVHGLDDTWIKAIERIAARANGAGHA